MVPRIWATSDNGQIIYQSLTIEYVEEVLDIMRKYYYVYETIANALEIYKCQEALKELEEIPLKIIQQGISIVAIDKIKNKVVGLSINELYERPKPNEICYLEDMENNFKNELAKNYINFLVQTDKNHDLFTKLNVDCYMEVVYVTVLSDYKNMGIAKKLSEASRQLATKLLAGDNVKLSLTGDSLPLEPVPKAIGGITTSPISEKVCVVTGFKQIAVTNFDKFNFLTKNVQELIGSKTFCVKIFWLDLQK